MENKMENKNEQTIMEIIELEKKALDKWFKGDTSGYKNLWSEKSFSYFDGVVEKRIDSHEEIVKFLDSIEGKLYAEKYDFENPRVQLGNDIAVLTFQIHSKTNLIDMHYNCVEIFQKEENGWRVIHSTWSFIRPMDMKFGKEEDII